MPRIFSRLLLAASLALAAAPSFADQAKIERVTARQTAQGWTFEVTIRHPDTGWDHYADGWSVNTPDGQELGYRKLVHPHQNEQPFTRSLAGIQVPNGLTEVVIKAHDTVHGWSDATYTVPLK